MNVWGFRVQPPTVDRALAAFLFKTGAMGRVERQLFERSIVPGTTVVDVGANQGCFTLLFSRLVGPAGGVVALEPEPAVCDALERNCTLNSASNVTCLRVAAGAERAQGALHCARFNRGDNRLTASATARSLLVEIVPLDLLLDDAEISFVKIDVQGHELHVATGMQRILERNAGIKVLFEYWPGGLERAGSAPDELLKFFVDRHFSLFELSRRGLRPVGGVRALPLSEWSWTNLLAVRE
jgi:FkbM family methyltransferase